MPLLILIILIFVYFILQNNIIRKQRTKITLNEIIKKDGILNAKNMNILSYNETKDSNILSNNKEYNQNSTYINNSLVQQNNLGELIWNNERIDLFKIKSEIKTYLNINQSFIKMEYYDKNENPKISLIITLYNQENFLPIIYTCILNQSFKDIEIIFIDDASIDNTEIKVKEYMEKDKRIIYLKNDINIGAFRSRNKAIYEAKGEYILILDPDDLLLNNILMKVYETAKQYNLDIVQFYMMTGTLERCNLWRDLRYKKGILYRPEIKNIFYYCITRNLVDKFVKREIFIKSIEFMNEKYRNERFDVYDDDVAFYGLINVANSYGFLEQIGYFYSYSNPNSRMKSLHSPKNANRIFHSLFCIMKYYYEQSENNDLEKVKVAYDYFYGKIYRTYFKDIINLTEGFNFIIEVIDLYLNCSFYNLEKKNYLNIFKNEINKRKNDISNFKNNSSINITK